MHHVSSNLTLFLKLFVPTFWLVFFGAFTIAVWLMGYEYYGRIPGNYMRWGATLFFLLGALFLWLTVLRLKRVEMDGDQVYVTNYFKHFRYAMSNIERISETDLVLFRLVTIRFKKAGYFGKKVHFLASRSRYQHYFAHHPELTRQLLEQEKAQN